MGRLDNLTVGLCGDLKFGRTVHSLIEALVRYTGIRFVLISPEELRLPSYIRKDVLDKKGFPYTEVESLEEALPELDVLYMTRVQKERFFNEEDYVRMKDFYILDVFGLCVSHRGQNALLGDILAELHGTGKLGCSIPTLDATPLLHQGAVTGC